MVKYKNRIIIILKIYSQIEKLKKMKKKTNYFKSKAKDYSVKTVQYSVFFKRDTKRSFRPFN